MNKYSIMNYLYEYKIKIENKKVITMVIERNYTIDKSDSEKMIIDSKDNLFKIYNLFKKSHISRLNIFKNQLINDINNSKYSYYIEIIYHYHKSKLCDKLLSKSDNYYEINIFSYNSNTKIGFNKKLKVKKLKYQKLKPEIFEYDIILDKNVDKKDGIIDSKNIIIKKYALSQLLSFDRNMKISNDNVVDEIDRKLKQGYVITNVYFLNNNKENRDNIKLMCVGYYVDNYQVKYLYANRLFIVNIDVLLKNIKYVSKSNVYDKKLNYYDILTENNNSSIIANN